MTKGRLEAFSDGVIAIVITIMVLELRPPHASTVAALRPLLPIFLSYGLSFVFIGIYWSNHHHLLQAAQQVDGRVLWANLHLLFWLSLVPFVTAWIGETGADALPVAGYGIVMLLAAVAYFILTHALLALHPQDSRLARALGADVKGRISVVVYAAGIAVAFAAPWAALACYVAVAVTWLIPDRRIERTIDSAPKVGGR
ncbi:MAG: DUF1211 domain-containing protein [Acidobacteria bacterium]|nr:DUF1211 domain-containing protein [Acidobacteriota bacterium]